MLGWPIGATLASRTFLRFGLGRLLGVGAALVPLGASAFALLGPDGSPVLAGAGSFVLGLGMGLVSLCSLILIQESVEVSQRGSATASNVFSRNLGSALGATFFGAIFNFALVRQHGGVAIPEDQLRQFLQGTSVDAATHAGIRLALGSSLHLTFVALLLTSLGMVALALLLPRQRPLAAVAESRCR
jgi:hypothetical protein